MEDEFKQARLMNAKTAPKMSIRFIQITDLNNQKTEQAFVIYRKSFPANERQKEEVVRQRLNSGTEDMFAGLKDDAVIAVSLYTSDAADERSSVDLGGRRIIKK